MPTLEHNEKQTKKKKTKKFIYTKQDAYDILIKHTKQIMKEEKKKTP